MLKWESKPPEQITGDIINFANEVQKYKDRHALWLWWSKVPIESEEELNRLDDIHTHIPTLFYGSYFSGEVYFIGYGKRPEGKTDKWFIPMRHEILEIYAEFTLEGTLPAAPITELSFDFVYSPEALASLGE